ncbi:MAG: hypothetical protein Q9205_006534, partial [Flavoplaca limonia]
LQLFGTFLTSSPQPPPINASIMAQPMSLLPPPTGIFYNNFSDLLQALNKHAKGQGYGIVTRRSKKDRRGVVFKHNLIYVRGTGGDKPYKNKGYGIRPSSSTVKCDCQFAGFAVQYQYAIRWQFKLRNPEHNHKASQPSGLRREGNFRLTITRKDIKNVKANLRFKGLGNRTTTEKLLEVIKKLLIANNIPSPKIWVTDKDTTLSNAIAVVFPRAAWLICKWHIKRNVEAHAKKHIKQVVNDGETSEEDEIHSHDENKGEVTDAPTEEAYENAWTALQEAYEHGRPGGAPKLIRYIRKTWILFKRNFIKQVQDDDENDADNAFPETPKAPYRRDTKPPPQPPGRFTPSPPLSSCQSSRSPSASPPKSPKVKDTTKGRPKVSKKKRTRTRREPSQEEKLVKALEKEKEAALKKRREKAAEKRKEKAAEKRKETAAAKRKETAAAKRKAPANPAINQRPRKKKKEAEETQYNSEFERFLLAGDEIYTPEELELVQGARARHQKQVAEAAQRGRQLGGGGGDLQHPREVIELSDDDFVDIERQNLLIYGP